MSRTLIVRYRKMGDSIMVTPVLQSLIACGHRFCLVTQPSLRPFFGEFGEIDGYVDVPSERPSTWEALQIGLRARRYRCDVALVFRFDRTAALIGRWAGCRVRAGSLRGSSRLLTANVGRTERFESLHQVEKYYAITAAALGQPIPSTSTKWPDRGFTLPPPISLDRREPWIGLHLDNGGSNRLWAESQLLMVQERLHASGLKTCTTGAGGSVSSFPVVRQRADLDLVGRTSPFALATAFYACRAVLAIDGGGPRIASAVGTPVLTVGLSDRWSEHQMSPWMAPGRALYRPEGTTPDDLFHALMSIL